MAADEDWCFPNWPPMMEPHISSFLPTKPPSPSSTISQPSSLLPLLLLTRVLQLNQHLIAHPPRRQTEGKLLTFVEKLTKLDKTLPTYEGGKSPSGFDYIQVQRSCNLRNFCNEEELKLWSQPCAAMSVWNAVNFPPWRFTWFMF